MNWYKGAMGIWEDIEEHGPGGKSKLTREDLSKKYNFDEMTEDEVDYTLNEQHKLISEHYRRDKFIDEYGWAVPSKEAMEKIKEFVDNDKILEVGSGYGLWAKLLRDVGINIHATDNFNWPEYSTWHPSKKQFTSIENISNVEAINKYPGYNILMMSWPTYDDPMALNSLQTFKGNKLIYIGEGYMGCTGCNIFHNLLDKEWEESGTVDIPQWDGLRDYLTFFVRK